MAIAAGDSQPWCNLADINRDGKVDKSDIDVAFAAIGQKCVLSDTPEICDGLDNNGDGRMLPGETDVDDIALASTWPSVPELLRQFG